MLGRHKEICPHIFLGKIVGRQDFQLAHEFNSFAVCDRLAAKHHAHVARTLGYMNPMARIAVDRYTLLSDIALHNRLLGFRATGRSPLQMTLCDLGARCFKFLAACVNVLTERPGFRCTTSALQSGRARSARYENFASFAFLRLRSGHAFAAKSSGLSFTRLNSTSLASADCAARAAVSDAVPLSSTKLLRRKYRRVNRWRCHAAR